MTIFFGLNCLQYLLHPIVRQVNMSQMSPLALIGLFVSQTLPWQGLVVQEAQRSLLYICILATADMHGRTERDLLH